MDSEALKNNLYSVRSRIARAAAASGGKVTLVAATKTVSASTVAAAVEMGITSVGENRVQELVAKREFVTGAEWHFIGTLQRNKAKYLVGSTALIQSVTNIPLAQEINALAAKRGIVQDVLIEVNIAGEPSKTGAAADALDELKSAADALENIRLRGLMAVPPRDAKDDVYASLYKLYDKYRGGAFDTLSVGMSSDYERAIANGSNMVRIGTALFGARS